MSIPIYKRFKILAEAIDAGDEIKAGGVLQEIEDLSSMPAAQKLYDYLKWKYQKRFLRKTTLVNSPLVAQEVACGRFFSCPDNTGQRQAEGGLRFNGKVKIRRPNHPLVTIITVVYNNVATVEQCMKSVFEQTYDSIEFIIIDGGSTDGTLALIERHEESIDYYVSEPDGGIYNAMNKGLSVARGDYIAFLNADDFYLSYAVSDSIEHIFINDLDLSYAGFYFADDMGIAIVADEGRAWDASMLVQGIPGGHETVFAHRDCYNAIGGYDESFRLAADYHWLMRAFKRGFKAAPLAKTILVMRMGGTSFDGTTEKEENFQLLKENFGDLPELTMEKIYPLKYYNNWHQCTLSDPDMIDLLSEANKISEDIHHSLFLTIENRKSRAKGTISPAEKREPGKLKIAIALTCLTNASGGAERIAIDAANELSRQGHAVTMIACHGLAGEPYYPLGNSIPYIDLAIHPYKQHYFEMAKDFQLTFEEWSGRNFHQLDYSPTEEDFDDWCRSGHLWKTQMYRGFFLAHDFDVVISHMPSTFPYILLGRDEADKALHIAALHSAPSFKFYSDLYPAESRFDRYMRLVSLENADLISVLFDEHKQQMPHPYREKCFTLPNFISTESAGGQPQEKGSKIILSVGRLTPSKDHARLLKAYAEVKKLYPDWQLLIYGNGPAKMQLEELCLELDLTFADIFKGTRRDIENAYKVAEIFAFPSIYEGFGLTVVEAMSFGVPTIGFEDCDGVKYLIEHEKNGLLASRTDESRSLTKVIIQLIESPELRREFGKNGTKSASYYTLVKHVEALECEIRSQLVSGHKEISTEGTWPEDKQASMRSAIVTTYTEGGAGFAAMRLQEGLLQIGEDVRTLSFSVSRSERAYQARLTPEMQSIYDGCKSLYSADNTTPGCTLFSPSYPSLTFDQLSLLKYFDVINLHWVQHILSNEAIGYLSRLGKPLVWTLHDMNPFTGGCHYTDGCENYKDNCQNCPQLKDTFNNYPAKILAAKKNHWSKDIVVVTPSKWLAECARESAVFRENRIEVVPNSLDTDIYHPTPRHVARRKLGLPERAKVLLFTCQSHDDRRKGFKELLMAAAMLTKRREEYHVVTFGRESEELKRLSLPYTALGHITDPTRLALGYSAADVTVLPTLADNLPNVILESAACGTPIVAFDSGGVGDAVIDDVTGYLVPRGDCNLLAEKTAKAASEDFRQRCRDHAVEYFSLEVQAKRYLALYRELLSKPREPNNEPTEKIFSECEDSLAAVLSKHSKKYMITTELQPTLGDVEA